MLIISGCIIILFLTSGHWSVDNLLGHGGWFPSGGKGIFLASGVILCTLILANFVLPLVSPSPKKSEVAIEYEERMGLRIEILRNVIQRLSSEQRDTNANATRAVIAMYNDRIQRMISSSDEMSDKQRESLQRHLRIEVIRHQQRYLTHLLDKDKIDPATAYRLARRLAYQEQILTHHRSKKWILRSALRRITVTARAVVTLIRQALPGVDESKKEAAVRDLRVLVEKETIRYLDHKIASGDSKYPPELLGEAVAEHTTVLNTLTRTRPSLIFMAETLDDTEDIMRKGYRYELEEIQDLYDASDISRGLMKLLRENVYLMQLDLEDRV